MSGVPMCKSPRLATGCCEPSRPLWNEFSSRRATLASLRDWRSEQCARRKRLVLASAPVRPWSFELVWMLLTAVVRSSLGGIMKTGLSCCCSRACLRRHARFQHVGRGRGQHGNCAHWTVARCGHWPAIRFERMTRSDICSPTRVDAHRHKDARGIWRAIGRFTAGKIGATSKPVNYPTPQAYEASFGKNQWL